MKFILFKTIALCFSAIIFADFSSCGKRAGISPNPMDTSAPATYSSQKLSNPSKRETLINGLAVRILSAVRSKDRQQPVVKVIYECQNRGGEAVSFFTKICETVLQNGKTCPPALRQSVSPGKGAFADILPGQKQTVKIAYRLNSYHDPVTVQIGSWDSAQIYGQAQFPMEEG